MADFHLLITDWFRQNCRDLPWRKETDPYPIWLSEVILQQTRVEQGMDYFYKFINNYPDVEALANATEQQVLRDWQGLGYYSRARNLHAAAKAIVLDHKGKFPNSFAEIRQLKGVGDYTASAIASIAFDLPHAVVDGNVYRVLSRYFDIDTPIDAVQGVKYFKELAQSLLGQKDHGTHNQALMEIGALVCKPQNPSCDICPLANSCLALKNGTIANRPVKEKRVKVKTRYFHYLIFSDASHVILQQRTTKDIWQNLFEFPLIETESGGELLDQLPSQPNFVSDEQVHILSHQRICARFYHFNFIAEQMADHWQLIALNQLEDFPVSRLIERYLENNELFH